MPPKKPSSTRRRVTRTKRYRKRYPGQAPTGRVRQIRPLVTQTQRGSLAFAPRYRTRISWTRESGLTTPASNLFGAVAFRLNGPYDPDVALAATGQPVCYDQLAAVYDTYRVMGAKVRLEFYNPNGDGYTCGYRIRKSSEPDTATQSMQAVSGYPFTELSTINNSGSQRKVFNFYVDMSVVFGKPKSTIASDDKYEALNTTTPVEQSWIDVICQSNNTTGGIQASFKITITYYAVWSNRKQIADV